MGLIETQALLARLFTDAQARAEFFADPGASARRFGLNSEEAASLARLDRRQLDDFARSLLGKRALDARKALPLTARALGESLDPLLIAALAGPPGTRRTHGDAAALVRALVARQDDARPWLGDLARYEFAFLEAARPGGAFLLRRFAYPVDEIARQLSRGAAPVDVRAGRRIGLWARAPGRGLFVRLF